MAIAFAEQERKRRRLENEIEIITGGTQPAANIHDVVVETMQEVGIDISDRCPREISVEELQATDIVITMGCSANDVCPATWSGKSRDWDLSDPHGQSAETVREIREEIRTRVGDLFEELDADQQTTP